MSEFLTNPLFAALVAISLSLSWQGHRTSTRLWMLIAALRGVILIILAALTTLFLGGGRDDHWWVMFVTIGVLVGSSWAWERTGWPRPVESLLRLPNRLLR